MSLAIGASAIHAPQQRERNPAPKPIYPLQALPDRTVGKSFLISEPDGMASDVSDASGRERRERNPPGSRPDKTI
jgi:hypothetical protein